MIPDCPRASSILVWHVDGVLELSAIHFSVFTVYRPRTALNWGREVRAQVVSLECQSPAIKKLLFKKVYFNF